MDQLKRITEMEQILDESKTVIANLQQALDAYRKNQNRLSALIAYYTGGVWLSDYEDDSAGKLPHDLKRGVLSEDAVYDLLSENDRLLFSLRQLLQDSEN